jgi:hypothetical protein
MNQPKILFIVSFVMVFCAGISIGAFVRVSQDEHHESAWLAEELGLSSTQQLQMKEIWDPVRDSTVDYPSQKRRELAEKRDRSVRDLLHEDQIAHYDQILENYSRNKEVLIKAWRAPFDDAMEKTRQILSEEQFRNFEELGKKHQGHEWNQLHSSDQPEDVKKDEGAQGIR